MPSIQHQPGPAARRGARARAPTALSAALALLIALAALSLRATAGPEHSSPAFLPDHALVPALPSVPASPARSPAPGSPRPGASPPAAAGHPADIGARLREILRVREEAFGRRDMRLLETVYTADCPCLWSGRAAIARLLADRAVWRGHAIAVEVSSLQRVSGRMWIAVALLSTRPFRIEREGGALIRAVPAARQRYRFVLVRPAPSGRWLLGDASLLGGGAP